MSPRSMESYDPAFRDLESEGKKPAATPSDKPASQQSSMATTGYVTMWPTAWLQMPIVEPTSFRTTVLRVALPSLCTAVIDPR